MPAGKKKTLFVTEIDLDLVPRLEVDLEAQGFQFKKAQYTVLAASKPGVSFTLYESGKLVVQGREIEEFISYYLEPEVLKTFEFSHGRELLNLEARMGVDESGKGDFFGPLCIAGVQAGGEQVQALYDLGVADSKSLSDKAIGKLAKEIRQLCPHHIIRIGPEKYNELYGRFKNVNTLLAWGHATVLQQLHEKTGCENAIIDQFALSKKVVERSVEGKGLDINLVQKHKGEEDVVVAAASILARESFVLGIHNLEKAFSCKLPKGASPAVIAAGKEFVKQHGAEQLKLVSKLHFKTRESII